MKPETTFVVGSARASVFLHRNRNRKTSQEFESYSVHVHRRYEKSPGEWVSTSYFRLFELPQVAMVLQLATAYVAEREAMHQFDNENGSDEDVEASSEAAQAAEATTPVAETAA